MEPDAVAAEPDFADDAYLDKDALAEKRAQEKRREERKAKEAAIAEATPVTLYAELRRKVERQLAQEQKNVGNYDNWLKKSQQLVVKYELELKALDDFAAAEEKAKAEPAPAAPAEPENSPRRRIAIGE